jgi:UDP-N-acetylmuramoylalanine-D-glutamate ligase
LQPEISETCRKAAVRYLPRRLKEYQVTEQIGFIGLGNRGAAFAARLLMTGNELQVCDVREQPVLNR